jgi:two-component sensor histidine kinase
MRALLLLVGLSLGIRTVLVLRRAPGPWAYVWPLVDVGFITAAARIGYAQPDSWIIALYVLPVLQAAATLDLRWSMAVAAIGAIACGAVNGFENLLYSYFLFRLAFLLIVASLVTRLAAGLVSARSRLALAGYRSELASEMHDGLQQYLGSIAMRLEVAEKSPAESGPLIASVKETARRASDELRLMLHRLRSPMLKGASLAEALRYQTALVGERSDLAIDLEIEGAPFDVPPKVEHELLRIAQEALTNVVKHAQATEVRVCLAYENGEVRLKIVDDGVGFDVHGTLEGLGMETMRNRSQAVRGNLEVLRNPQKGTTVQVRVPIDAATSPLSA